MSWRDEKPHWSMWLYAANPVIEVGDTVRLRQEAQWMDGHGGELFVPAGVLGVVQAWNHDGYTGTAIAFQGFTHPQYRVWPMACRKSGASRYSDSFELIHRRTPDHDDPPPPLSHQGMPEIPYDWSSDVPRMLEPYTRAPQGKSPQGGPEGILKPGTQKSSPRSRGRRTGAPRPQEIISPSNPIERIEP